MYFFLIIRVNEVSYHIYGKKIMTERRREASDKLDFASLVKGENAR